MNNQELAPHVDNLTCPRCQLSHIKRNGHTYYGKQNYRCKSCGRQFVFREPSVSDPVKQLICRLLLERISLRGICRVLDVSLCWLLNFMRRIYKTVPADLNFRLLPDSEFDILCLEADEMWSFVQQKTNKQWIWLILERRTGQVVAVHIGDRSEKSAAALWQKLPPEVKANALILTDHWEAYALAIPAHQHTACGKGSGQTSFIEGFNCRLRQRVSRLVRKTTSFSKNKENHQGAINYFLSYNNLEQQKLHFAT
jgi:IS1 family transposase/transposase-like protein